MRNKGLLCHFGGAPWIFLPFYVKNRFGGYKYMIKKWIAAVLCILLLLTVFAGCGTNKTKESDNFSVVTTIFPIYDWVRQISGDKAEITLLLNNGVDLHSYQPTADDIVKISTCDVFIYVGGESDAWVDEVLRSAENPNMVIINLLDALGEDVKEEEIVEGMEADHEHDHDHDEEEHEHEHEEEPEYDEHVWLSLKNAQQLCGIIADGLGKADTANEATYKENAENYCKHIQALDEKYQQTVQSGSIKTLVFGDRFPFRYMTDDYDLDYYAAFVGCSAESEASFETVVFLANKVDELGITAVMQIESSDGSIARTVVENTKTKNQEILTLDSMQSVTSTDVEEGITYLNVMEQNLEVLTQALK